MPATRTQTRPHQRACRIRLKSGNTHKRDEGPERANISYGKPRLQARLAISCSGWLSVRPDVYPINPTTPLPVDENMCAMVTPPCKSGTTTTVNMFAAKAQVTRPQDIHTLRLGRSFLHIAYQRLSPTMAPARASDPNQTAHYVCWCLAYIKDRGMHTACENQTQIMKLASLLFQRR